jgi:large subunit ribosomal protein L10
MQVMEAPEKERAGVARKREIVQTVSAVAEKAVSLVAAEYSGITCNDFTELRKEGRNAGVHIQVVRNSLAKRALTGTEYECIMGDLKGPLFLAFSLDDHAAAAKLLTEYSDKNDIVKLKSAAFESEVYDVKTLLDLPTKEESMAKIVALLQSKGMKIVSVLSNPALQLTRTVQGVADQMEES